MRHLKAAPEAMIARQLIPDFLDRETQQDSAPVFDSNFQKMIDVEQSLTLPACDGTCRGPLFALQYHRSRRGSNIMCYKKRIMFRVLSKRIVLCDVDWDEGRRNTNAITKNLMMKTTCSKIRIAQTPATLGPKTVVRTISLKLSAPTTGTVSSKSSLGHKKQYSLPVGGWYTPPFFSHFTVFEA